MRENGLNFPPEGAARLLLLALRAVSLIPFFIRFRESRTRHCDRELKRVFFVFVVFGFRVRFIRDFHPDDRVYIILIYFAVPRSRAVLN